jgi:hypothetical protein
MKRRTLLSITLPLSVGVFSAFAVRATQQRVTRRLAWLDIDLPQARDAQRAFADALSKLGESINVQVVVTPFFWRRKGALSDLGSKCEDAVRAKPELYICLSHHSALLIRKAVPEAQILLITVIDPDELGLARRNLAGVSFDKPDSSRALSLLSEWPSVKQKEIGVAAAAEWLTPGRIAHLQSAASRYDVRLQFVAADTLEQLASSEYWLPSSDIAAWWIPESILLFDYRAKLVTGIAEKEVPHVFGRKVSVERGAMLGLQPYSIDWRRWLLEMLFDYLQGVPIDNLALHKVDSWHCFGNVDTIRSATFETPPAVLANIDAYV